MYALQYKNNTSSKNIWYTVYRPFAYNSVLCFVAVCYAILNDYLSEVCYAQWARALV
ncbi:hypothetical protein HMPREF1584_00317 [Gardnerella vaginalis JCP8481A]|nr:hypothetical protein HMPREF1585_00915 [Gardnerella vaginalis JCP8481B]EPI44056.1 hypothetical protein HMPREF1584_00317 [Gardnerella vaginalis JCP8481A]